MANNVHTLSPAQDHARPRPQNADHAVISLHRARPTRPPHVVLLTNDLCADRGIGAVLADTSCAVTTAETVDAALSLMDGLAYDLVIVDIRPDIIGYEAVRRLRLAGVTAPVLFISALTTHEGWDQARLAGADAVMTLPVDASVLETRIAGLVRQHAPTEPMALEVGGVRVVPATRTAFVAGHALPLSAVEYAVLEALVARGGAPLHKAAIAARMTTGGHVADAADVGAAVSPLRRKLIAAGAGPLVRAVGRQGYAAGMPGAVAVMRVTAPATTARAA